MIVVAVIAAILGIALPNFLRTRIQANESATLSGLRTIYTALESYRANRISPSYPRDLAELSLPYSNPPYIDQALANATRDTRARHGYWFEYHLVDPSHFFMFADPRSGGAMWTTGGRWFFLDQTGVIRTSTTHRAGPTDPEIQ